MQIRARLSMSADGFVTTPSGWPALTADPAFVSGKSHGFPEFLEGCEAALMGRTTFEPALNNDRWSWPSLNVFLLASQRPPGGDRLRLPGRERLGGARSELVAGITARLGVAGELGRCPQVHGLVEDVACRRERQ